ncbi:glycine cleavage system aminomethyltransferase GcvT [Micromonospora sp. DR5-3]|uniref:glycine cleavage system aminomethyltransferase GcvT n=1 Tax=unclassified Micromonospora TaxID=2617518 RepID=UPI0011D464C4|nr:MULTISPECIES: glycine cleavage system aminomethyltransferase GcvT [unclassified Micromonospora]MCW3818777.1 glycine cleavage system aminomethyltransferase GcvT [Micromonospora sp. DR5-3]TYC21567.1 glycine cleavage system aminomethyltransferase GcvT [Micromonospora sp. MP36]
MNPSGHSWRCTPLHDVHAALGASFTGFAGWSMPIRYSSEIAEHKAVRSTAGLFDLCHMGELELTGREAGAALDFALVGRPSKIGVGRARYSMICAEDGGILDDLVVYRLAEERFLVVANAANVLVVRDALNERASGFDAAVRDASDDWALIAVQGPASAEIVSQLTDLDVSALRYYAIDEAVLAGATVLLARTGYTGEDGFEVYCRPEDAAAVWAALTEAGEQHGLVPAGLACRDTLRLEAGMPLYGQELGRDVTPFEAGLDRVVAFDKDGGFVGEAALAARRVAGARRTLVGLVSAGRRSPRAGYPVLDPSTGAQIGRVTSGAPSPTLGRPIAMAYVPVGRDEPGTRLAVDIRGAAEDVEVVALPFYRRNR